MSEPKTAEQVVEALRDALVGQDAAMAKAVQEIGELMLRMPNLGVGVFALATIFAAGLSQLIEEHDAESVADLAGELVFSVASAGLIDIIKGNGA